MLGARMLQAASGAGVTYATPTLVQSATASGAASTTPVLAAPATAGNVLVAFVSTTGAISQVSANEGSAGFWVAVGSDVVGGTVSTNIYRVDATGGEQTISVAGVGGTAVAVIQEWSGLTTVLDVTPSTASTASTVTSLAIGAMATTTRPVALLGCVGAPGNMGTQSWASEALTNTVGAASRLMAGRLNKTTTGAYGTTGNWTTNRPAASLLVALRAKAA